MTLSAFVTLPFRPAQHLPCRTYIPLDVLSVRLRRKFSATKHAREQGFSNLQWKHSIGTTLAQTARVIMAGFQIGSLATTQVVQPLYTAETWATITPSALAALQTVGFAQLGVVLAVNAASSRTREAHIINVVTMALTALIYVVLPVKPLYINLPFVSTLFAVAVANLVNYLQLPKDELKVEPQNNEKMASAFHNATQVMKAGSGVGSLVVAYSFTQAVRPSIISTVYFFQVGLNLLASAVIGMRTGRTPMAADTVLLAGASLCLARSNVALATAIAAAATLAAASSLRKASTRS